MVIATAILLSAVIISTVLLYGFTQDRWPWDRVIGSHFRRVRFQFRRVGALFPVKRSRGLSKQETWLVVAAILFVLLMMFLS